jgi:3-hydroxybutyryl-CoA dehydratase
MTVHPVQLNDSFTTTKTITARDVELFADLVDDHNPVHLDEAFAATTRFGRRIAHGMLSAGLISAAIANGWPGAIYLSQTLQFRAPVYLGDTVTAKVIVTRVRGDKPIVTYRTECHNQDDTLLLEGEAVCLVPE